MSDYELIEKRARRLRAEAVAELSGKAWTGLKATVLGFAVRLRALATSTPRHRHQWPA